MDTKRKSVAAILSQLSYDRPCFIDPILENFMLGWTHDFLLSLLVSSWFDSDNKRMFKLQAPKCKKP